MPSLNITNSTDVVDNASTNVAAEGNTSTTLVAGDNSSATTTEATHDKETGEFCLTSGICFNLKTPEGRQALIEYIGKSADEQIIDQLEEYIRKHHPDGNVRQILGQEAINTILAGFISGRVATGGAAPLTTEQLPPKVDLSSYFSKEGVIAVLKMGAALLGHSTQAIAGALDSLINSVSFGLLSRENGIQPVPSGALIDKDSFWGSVLNTSGIKEFFGVKDHGDGTLSVGNESEVRAVSKLTTDIVSLLYIPNAVKKGVSKATAPALAKLSNAEQNMLKRILEDISRDKHQLKLLKTGDRKVDTLVAAGPTAKGIGRKVAHAGVKAGYGAAKLAGMAAPTYAEWKAAEALFHAKFDEYNPNSNASAEFRETWADWFAFNYVWADFTLQAVTKGLGLLYSFKGNRKTDLKTIGGAILSAVVAEILTGSQIIAGIGLTKIAEGSVSTDEVIARIINAHKEFVSDIADLPYEDIYKVLTGQMEGVSTGDQFDIVTLDGKKYSIAAGQNLIVDENGDKIPFGSALGNRIRQAWKEQTGGEGQTLNKNGGGLIALHPIKRARAMARSKGGLIAY